METIVGAVDIRVGVGGNLSVARAFEQIGGAVEIRALSRGRGWFKGTRVYRN